MPLQCRSARCERDYLFYQLCKKVLTIIFEFHSAEGNADFNQDVANASLFFLTSAIFFLTETVRVPTLPLHCFAAF